MTEQRHFISYLRRGARTALTDGTEVDLGLVLDVDGVAQTVTVRGLQLAGPEHARGIAASVVRKRYPAAGSTDLRPGALPYVEWHDPSLPWALSPTAPQAGRLTPFLALLCVEEGPAGPGWLQEDRQPAARALINSPQGLPDPAAFELMAHVEDPGALHGPDTAPTAMAFARMLCPQRLAPLTRYVALVVPLYERGRLAGLGEPLAAGGTDGFAWQAGDTNATLPVYLSWQFTTGEGRGPEQMLRDLRAVAPTGRRVEVSVAEEATAALVPALSGTHVTKRVIFPVAAAEPPHARPGMGAALDVGAAQHDGRLPLPTYGREYTGEVEADADDAPRWFAEANLDPSLRVMAGHGASIVRRLQDAMVGFVLDSAGQLEEANAVLSRAHTAMTLTGRLHSRLVVGQVPVSTWSRLVGPAAARTRYDGESFATELAGSVDGVLQDPVLHRAMAVGGPLDRERADRGDPAEAIAGAMAAATAAPVVPGASPLEHDIDELDRSTVGRSEVVGLGPESLEHAIERAVGGSVELGEDVTGPVKETHPGFEKDRLRPPEVDLAVADVERRSRQEADRRRSHDEPAPAAPSQGRSALGSAISRALDPRRCVPPRITTRISGLPEGSLPRSVGVDPVWPDPVVPELFAIEPDAVSPGLAELPNDAVMGLTLDAAAVDALMLGANVELLRELRWRGIPHRRRVSPVRRAFSAPADEDELPPDTAPLRSWGSSQPLGGGRQSDLGLVVLIRSPLFQEFPETVVTVVEAAWDRSNGRRELVPQRTHLPQVMGSLGADVSYVGFALDRREMVGDPNPSAGRAGGFLVFQQPAGGLTFGLGDDVDNAGGPRALDSWNQLSWSDLTEPEIRADTLSATVGAPMSWGENSATMAAILLERPVTVALHISDINQEST